MSVSVPTRLAFRRVIARRLLQHFPERQEFSEETISELVLGVQRKVTQVLRFISISATAQGIEQSKPEGLEWLVRHLVTKTGDWAKKWELLQPYMGQRHFEGHSLAVPVMQHEDHTHLEDLGHLQGLVSEEPRRVEKSILLSKHVIDTTGSQLSKPTTTTEVVSSGVDAEHEVVANTLGLVRDLVARFGITRQAMVAKPVPFAVGTHAGDFRRYEREYRSSGRATLPQFSSLPALPPPLALPRTKIVVLPTDIADPARFNAESSAASIAAIKALCREEVSSGHTTLTADTEVPRPMFMVGAIWRPDKRPERCSTFLVPEAAMHQDAQHYWRECDQRWRQLLGKELPEALQ